MKIDRRNFSIKCIISIVLSLVVGILFANRFMYDIERMVSDKLYQRPGVVPSDIKIIAIDEATLLKLGPYTDWDRKYFADLIEILNSNEETAPRVIGVDVIFSGTNDTESDKILAEVAGKYDNLIFASSVTVDSYLHKENGKYYQAQYVSGEGKPYEELAQVTEYGFTNVIYDKDGFVRKAYTNIISEYNGKSKVYNSFAYTIASKINKDYKYDSQVEVAFTGKPGEFEIISMNDVLEGKISAENFKDAIILIGAYEEGMMDSYRVPVDYSQEMYGVELQANYVNAFINNRIVFNVNIYIQFMVTFFVVLSYSFFAMNTRMRNAIIALLVVVVIYIFGAIGVFQLLSYKVQLLAVPFGAVMVFFASAVYKYINMQKKRIHEMREMLFSMAEAMSEAIEGRTPYNANHTKNVAKRCVEMVDYINYKHRKKKTEIYIKNSDKEQLYLAAMLHDVGKMDVPLEVMDKPTKLGNREEKLRYRLELISLKLHNDALMGCITQEEADVEIAKIHTFMESLGAFNCGRPLKDDEWAIINEMSEKSYADKEGKTMQYLTEEEINDLHIKAGTLSDNEREIMQSHVVYTDKILSHMHFGEHFKDVRAMASNHHELLNGRGYPKGIREEEIDTMTRILTIMDIYDSLIADDRPYKKPKSVKVAFEILDEEAEAGKIDKELLQIAKELYMK